MQRIKTAVKSFKDKAQDVALNQLSPENADKVRTMQNIKRHQGNLHANDGALSTTSTIASVAKQIPEPHIQAVARVVSSATSTIQKGRMISDYMTPKTRAQATPLISTAQKRAGSSGYGTFD